MIQRVPQIIRPTVAVCLTLKQCWGEWGWGVGGAGAVVCHGNRWTEHYLQMSHEHNDQQRPESLMVTLIWRASKYKVHKFHHISVLQFLCPSGRVYVPCIPCIDSCSKWELQQVIQVFVVVLTWRLSSANYFPLFAESTQILMPHFVSDYYMLCKHHKIK